MAIVIIDRNDLSGIPGVSGTDAELDYAAKRASARVEEAWCNPTGSPPQWVRDIAIDVAVRYLTNPRGVSSVTRRVDDASRTERYGEGGPGAVPQIGFHLTDDEKTRLCPKVRRSVGTITTKVPGYR